MTLFKAAVAAVCAYEVAALLTGRAPTVSNLCGRNRCAAPLVLVALAAHLYHHPRRESE